MSKFKREQLKKQKEKEITAKGLQVEHKSTSADIEENDFKESVVRDTTIIAQMLNDYPYSEDIKTYHAESMGVMVIDLPKDYLAECFRKTLAAAGVSQEKAEKIADDVLKLRVLTVRFKD